MQILLPALAELYVDELPSGYLRCIHIDDICILDATQGELTSERPLGSIGEGRTSLLFDSVTFPAPIDPQYGPKGSAGVH